MVGSQSNGRKNSKLYVTLDKHILCNQQKGHKVLNDTLILTEGGGFICHKTGKLWRVIYQNVLFSSNYHSMPVAKYLKISRTEKKAEKMVSCLRIKWMQAAPAEIWTQSADFVSCTGNHCATLFLKEDILFYPIFFLLSPSDFLISHWENFL